jgi:integrase
MARARRGRGEGTIRQRPDGKWEARFTVHGKPKSVYAATKQEVIKRLDELRATAGIPLSSGAEMKLGEYLDFWLRTIVKPKRRYQTYESYRHTVEKHIKPYLGHIPLQKLNPGLMLMLEEAHKAQGDKFRAATSWYARVVLKIAVRQAVFPLRLLNLNPFADVRLEKPATRKMQTWSMEDARKFFSSAEKRKVRLLAFYVIGVLSGLRHSELLALKATDFDFKVGTLSITKQLLAKRIKPPEGSPPGTEGTTEFSIEPVKTKASEGVIPVPNEVLDIVKTHMANELAKGRRHEFLFMTKNGTHYEQTNVRSAFYRTVKAAGVPRIRIHDFRHTCATLLLEAGKDIKDIQYLLRHANFTITANTYAHVTTKKARAIADTMGELYRQGGVQ